MKYVIALGGKQYEVNVSESEAELVSVTDMQPAAAPAIAPAAVAQPAAVPAPAAKAATAEGTPILAPMPGTVLSVSVAEGAGVKAGQVLLVFEAMKMENEIAAPSDGTIKQVLVQKGSAINTDDVLIVM